MNRSTAISTFKAAKAPSFIRNRKSFPRAGSATISRTFGRSKPSDVSLLIKNGEVITSDERYVADIFCENETITRIERNIDKVKPDEVVDASGKYVFPGFIDPHVHIYLPFMGTFAKDNYETASRAALVGGTTTLIEMVCPSRADEPWQAYELWKSQAAGKEGERHTVYTDVTR